MNKKQIEENKTFLKKLKKRKPKNLDKLVHTAHDQVFNQIDCLTCANCCKNTGPLFTNLDILKISKKLKMKEGKFIDTYLRLDEDKDYVLQSLPCSFLGEDNRCFIYDFRPKACREYPHTDRKKFHQILDVTLKNCGICPAVDEIVNKIKNKLS